MTYYIHLVIWSYNGGRSHYKILLIITQCASRSRYIHVLVDNRLNKYIHVRVNNGFPLYVPVHHNIMYPCTVWQLLYLIPLLPLCLPIVLSEIMSFKYAIWKGFSGLGLHSHTSPFKEILMLLLPSLPLLSTYFSVWEHEL